MATDLARTPNVIAARATGAAARLHSLDVFRGATMAMMVIVNNPGDWGHIYWPLDHAEWNGWTPTDLVFPFFLFIVGVSITISRGSASWGRILRRSALIFATGLLLAGFPRFPLATWRIMGVLQRIALCYLATASLYRLTSAQGAARQARVFASIAAALLAGYWIVMTQIAWPWTPKGDLSPEGNLGAVLDRALMLGHLWKPRWDPEGILSTFPAIATTITGVLAGAFLRPRASKMLPLAAAGVAAIVAGLVWDRAFPINKNLWTSSYVLFTSGIAAVLLALCSGILDRRATAPRWAHPFIVLGTNAITLFVLSGVIAKLLILIHVTNSAGQRVALKTWIYNGAFVPLAASPYNTSLIFAFANLVVLYAILAVMYGRRVFVRF